MKKKNSPTQQNKSKPEIVVIANNKKAHYEYEILEKLEAGIELRGTEIKSIREGRVNLREAYIIARGGQARIIGMDISPYTFGNIFNHKATRERQLLLHKKEIFHLEQKTVKDGLTLIPLSLYIKGRIAKLSIGLCRGKKLHDKRALLHAKDTQREIQRTLKSFNN